MGGWTGGRVDGSMGGLMDRWARAWVDGWMAGWLDGWNGYGEPRAFRTQAAGPASTPHRFHTDPYLARAPERAGSPVYISLYIYIYIYTYIYIYIYICNVYSMFMFGRGR